MSSSCHDMRPRYRLRPRRARHGFQRLLALLLALAVVLAACGDDSDDSVSDATSGTDSAGGSFDEAPDSTDEGDASAPAAEVGDFDSDDMADEPAEESVDESADEEAATEGDSDSLARSGGGADFSVPAVAVALAVGRQIIFTGDVVIEADDVAQATDEVIAAVSANGGAIWGQDTRTDPEPRTVLTIRVPPEDFDRVLNAISGVATLVSQSVSTDDVTEVVIDLDARITAAESSVDRVQTLLDAARDLNTVFTLEEELATRQAQLERLRGQRKTIGDQITLATITLTILELDPDRLGHEMEVVAWLGSDVDDACPGVSDLSIDADDTAVLCVNVSNTGEDTLTEIELQSSRFRLRTDDFRIEGQEGSLDSLAPGAELLLYVELEAEGGFIRRVDTSSGINIDVTVTAVPETSPTVELISEDSVFVSADVDDPLPGFADSFSSGLGAMIAVISVLMIGVGVALPFLPFLLPLAWLGRRSLIKNRERADALAATRAEPAQPSPPPPPPAN